MKMYCDKKYKVFRGMLVTHYLHALIKVLKPKHLKLEKYFNKKKLLQRTSSFFISTHFHVYFVINRQTVSRYYKSSVELDTQDAGMKTWLT